MSNYLNIHVLQTVAPSNLNRDESGRPKTAEYGGVIRHRVSSQSWKHSMRNYFRGHNVNTAYRTLKLPEMIAEEILKQDSNLTLEEALQHSIAGLKTLKLIGDKSKSELKTDALTMVSQAQVEQFVRVLIEAEYNVAKAKKDLTNALNVKNSSGIDLSIFGRMVASAPELTIEGAALVSHAISTHKIATDFDFYTASDDLLREDEVGAGMMGDIEFVSSTLYRYGSLNLSALAENLGIAATPENIHAAEKDFIDAFVKSIPSGKQTSFATPTLPSFILLTKSDSPISYVAAFEKPVQASSKGYIAESIDTLVKYVDTITGAYELKETRSAIVTEPTEIEAVKTIAEVLGYTDAVNKILYA